MTENHLDKVLCPFCSAPWTKDMVKVYYDHGEYSTGTPYNDDTVIISCHKCERVIYQA